MALARALLLQPAVLLLDEPTSGLDAAARARVTAVLSAAQQAWPTGILVASHDAEPLGKAPTRLIDLGTEDAVTVAAASAENC